MSRGERDGEDLGCIGSKRRGQERLLAEIEGLSEEEELAHWRRLGAAWQMERLRGRKEVTDAAAAGAQR